MQSGELDKLTKSTECYRVQEFCTKTLQRIGKGTDDMFHIVNVLGIALNTGNE